jgi:hypothetical protein
VAAKAASARSTPTPTAPNRIVGHRPRGPAPAPRHTARVGCRTGADLVHRRQSPHGASGVRRLRAISHTAIHCTYDRLAVFTVFLEEGYKQNPELPRLCSEAIAAVTFEFAYRGVRRRPAAAEKPTMLPTSVYVCLAPFLGPDQATDLVHAMTGDAQRTMSNHDDSQRPPRDRPPRPRTARPDRSGGDIELQPSRLRLLPAPVDNQPDARNSRKGCSRSRRVNGARPITTPRTPTLRHRNKQRQNQPWPPLAVPIDD